MAFVSQSEALWQEFSAVIQKEGLELYDLELAARSSSGASLRVTISKPVVSAPSSSVVPGSSSSLSVDEGETLKIDEDELPEGPKSVGITSGDCTRVCRRLMAFCETDGTKLGIGSEPELDVSSPGLDRSLRLPEHFLSAVGEVVKCIPQGDVSWGEFQGKPLVGVLRGELLKSDEANVHIREERTGLEIVFPLKAVKRANVEFVPESNGKKK